MTYQYLFCPTCGLRRMGHAYRCSVCSSLLHRDVIASHAAHPALRTLVSARPGAEKRTEPQRAAA